MISSDYNGITEKGKKLHKLFGIDKLMKYESINIFNIGYPDNYFDLVVLKSVIGGLKLQRDDPTTRTTENQKLAVNEIKTRTKTGRFVLGC